MSSHDGIRWLTLPGDLRQQRSRRCGRCRSPVVHPGHRTAGRGPSATPKSGEVVLTKSRTGPFSTTNLDEVLKKQGIETLVLMGISTSGCVITTVRWGADIDYKLVVLSDCCADQDDEIQRVLMEKLFPRQATVLTSQQFLGALE